MTTIGGDQLLATLAGGRELKMLDGKGNTRVVDRAPDGAESTSTGDLLHVTFVPGVAHGPSLATQTQIQSPNQTQTLKQTQTQTLARTTPSPARGHPAGSSTGGTAQVEAAVQTGNVTMVQTPAPGAKNADGTPQAPMRATAARADYEGATAVLHLTGDPRLHNDSLALTADKVDYHRDSGDATAFGNVKATYVQQSGQKGASVPALGGDGPVHVVADHAQMTRADNLSIFYGTPTAQARMWQGADAVAAPVLELARDQQTLYAHGAPGERGAVVHATLGARQGAEAHPPTNPSQPGVSAVLAAPIAPAASAAQAASRSGGPSRLASATLHYSDKDRRADLHGAVVAEQPTGVVHADEAQVFLTPNIPGKPSGVDHMVATGNVVITQPGRRGTGARLVYTAADGRYVLTGSSQQPPRVTDAEKGTTTGAALIFKGADDSVEVAGQGSPGMTTRTVTDTHSPK